MSHPDGSTAVSFILKAPNFASNSTLDDSGFVPFSPRPSDHVMPLLRLLPCNDILCELFSQDLRKACDPSGVVSLLLLLETLLGLHPD